MNLFVLSELGPQNRHVGWSVSHTLEIALASCCEATFIYPQINEKIELFNRYNLADDKIAFLRRYRHRIFKSWYEILDPPSLGEGPNVLLVIGLTPSFLLSIHALGSLLDKFDLRIAYLLDGFPLKDIDRAVIEYLDHVFVITAEIADEINAKLPLAATFLPLATDALRLGRYQHNKPIDIIGYGRIKAEVHQHLQAHFNQIDSGRIYHHSTFRSPEVDDLEQHILLLSKLLANSKISLCFEPSYIKRFQGYSPILYRWFEGWSCGCMIVGKKPFGKGVSELIDWENSTIDLPDDSTEWIPFIEEILQDEETLLESSQRNYRECLLRHDWRYRIRDMFQILNLPIPEKLRNEIDQLAQKAGSQLAERFPLWDQPSLKSRKQMSARSSFDFQENPQNRFVG